jgi:prefoldin beta subunit
MSEQEAQKMMMEMQQNQQRMQQVMQQKEETESEIQESKRALDELEQSDEGDVYRQVGNILVARDRDKLEEELEEKIDDLEARLKTLEKKEGQIRDKLEESQKKIQGSLGQ